MFPLTETVENAQNRDILKNSIGGHLEMLQQRFKSYFPDLDISKCDWVRTPFNQSTLSNAGELKLKAREQLAEICMNHICMDSMAHHKVRKKTTFYFLTLTPIML